MRVERFQYDSREAMRNDAKAQGYDFPASETPVETLKEPVTINHVKINSRILAQPVEGFDAGSDGAPTQRTIKRYQNMVRHGFRLLWLESVAVSEEGRSNPAQLWITEENADAFRNMLSEIREASDEPVSVVIQLTHSGRYSNPAGIPAPLCAFDNPYIPKPGARIVSDEEVQKIEDDYVHAVLLAERAGFDVVDIRACHGYLINEFFSAYNRPGRYGGSFENRIRFYLNVLDKVQAAVSSVQTATRLNMYDGLPYPYGWGVSQDGSGTQSYEEPMRLIRLIYDRGIRIFNITNGIGAYSPFVIRPYDSGGKEPDETQFAGAERMLQSARMVKEAAHDAVVIASAFTWFREYGADIAAGGIEAGWFDIAGFGRQTIAYPEMIEDLMKHGGMRREKCCKACCGCTRLIKEKGENVRCIFRKED